MSLKILTVLGTRPEIIRLSLIIPKLDELCDHVVVHTGQNYDQTLSDVFFEDLDLREPDIHLGIESTRFADQTAQILSQVDDVIEDQKPDRLLILGDTNSGLSSIVAARRGIPVYHLEAGNRCYDDRVPEEINRRIIDHCSNVLLPYTERSRKNLLREGIPGEAIYVIGNPIYEVLTHFDNRISESTVLSDLGLTANNYILVTMHRAENVDVEDRLRNLSSAMDLLADYLQLPVIVSTHPRTRARLESANLENQNSLVRFMNPFGFRDFIYLEQNAHCVFTDSGTVQEECSILRVPNVTLRDVTERPETIECGSNMLAGVDPGLILTALKTVLHSTNNWNPVNEYLEEGVSNKVVKIVLGYST